MERRVSDTVLFTNENNDITNQGVDKSFFTSEKNGRCLKQTKKDE